MLSAGSVQRLDHDQAGKQLEAPGKQEEQLSHEIDQAVQALIDEALQSGKAAPANSAAPN